MWGRKSRRIAALRFDLAEAEWTIEQMAESAMVAGERTAALERERNYLADLLTRVTHQLSIRLHASPPKETPAVRS